MNTEKKVLKSLSFFSYHIIKYYSYQSAKRGVLALPDDIELLSPLRDSSKFYLRDKYTSYICAIIQYTDDTLRRFH